MPQAMQLVNWGRSIDSCPRMPHHHAKCHLYPFPVAHQLARLNSLLELNILQVTHCNSLTCVRHHLQHVVLRLQEWAYVCQQDD